MRIRLTGEWMNHQPEEVLELTESMALQLISRKVAIEIPKSEEKQEPRRLAKSQDKMIRESPVEK